MISCLVHTNTQTDTNIHFSSMLGPSAAGQRGSHVALVTVVERRGLFLIDGRCICLLCVFVCLHMQLCCWYSLSVTAFVNSPFGSWYELVSVRFEWRTARGRKVSETDSWRTSPCPVLLSIFVPGIFNLWRHRCQGHYSRGWTVWKHPRQELNL